VPDYAPNFTARYKLTYSFEGDTHECNTRWPSGSTSAANILAAGDFWFSFLNATVAVRHTSFAVVGAEYAAADSNIFLPAAVPPSADPGERVAAAGGATRIYHSIWAGRSALGAKTRFQMFGLAWASADDTNSTDFYISATEVPLIGTLALLIESSGMVGPDDEDVLVVRPRIAYKQNDAWVNKRRSGS
jgi:hypothetical protein